jgi:FG-GAP-like repeat
MGLPAVFDEGALFFDWNNDGRLDILLNLPNDGPQLYEFNPRISKFEYKSAFPARAYAGAYGVNAGDLNGDGWQDVYVSDPVNQLPRIFLNHHGNSFAEFRSASTDPLGNYAAPAFSDMNGDGRVDIVAGGNLGILMNTGTAVPNVPSITLPGPNGERNQYGRVVELTRQGYDQRQTLTRIVDGGSGYIAHGD